MADLDSKVMGDLVASFFTSFAEAVVTILMAGWTAMEQAVAQFLTISIGGGPWVMGIILIFVLCVWFVVVKYPEFAGL